MTERCSKCNAELVVGEYPKGYPITPMSAMNGFSAIPKTSLAEWREICDDLCYGCDLELVYSADIAEQKQVYNDYIEEHDKDAQDFLNIHLNK